MFLMIVLTSKSSQFSVSAESTESVPGAAPAGPTVNPRCSSILVLEKFGS